MFKGALWSFGGKDVNQKRKMPPDWNKLILKNNTVSYCFTLLTFGGPCHLSSFSVLWTLFPSENSLFIQLWKRFCIVCVFSLSIFQLLHFWVWLLFPYYIVNISISDLHSEQNCLKKVFGTNLTILHLIIQSHTLSYTSAYNGIGSTNSFVKAFLSHLLFQTCFFSLLR